MDAWSGAEARHLRDLKLDPQRNPPGKLVKLVRHFKQGGTLWAVTEGGEALTVSKGLARKVRGLTEEGELDWVLSRPRVAPERPATADVPNGRRVDPESVLHRRELFYFGRRLRDLLTVPLPLAVIETKVEEYEVRMWGSWPSVLECPPRDTEEEEVASQWGSSPYNGRKHPLFPAFRQHLSGHQCWTCLDEMKAPFIEYGAACRRAFQAIIGELRSRLPDISDRGADAAAISLLTDGLYRKGGNSGLNFSYKPHEVVVDDHTGYQLRFGAWGTGLVDNPAELQSLANIHQDLRKGPPLEVELDDLTQANKKLNQARAEFQAALSPDALLRRLILNRGCDSCP